MNSMLVGVTHCIPCVMNSMYAWLHVCRVPCLPGSCAQGSMLARFYLLWILVRRVPCLPGSSYVGFHAYRAPFVTDSCTQVSRVSGSKHAGFHLLPVLVLRVLPVMNSNHAGLQPHRTPITPAPCSSGSMCYELLCVVLCSGLYVLWILVCRIPCTPVLCFMNSMHAGL